MNLFPNFCPRPVSPPITPPPAPAPERRRRLDGLQEGDPILVQTPSGLCEQGVFLRISDDFLIWARTISGASYIAITSLDSISITRL